MKILHLADLHIGKRVNGFSMLEEQTFILEQILEYIREEQPQAVLIAGDVYDKPMPSVEAVRVFDQFLIDLKKEKVEVLIISGNHDSPERLGFGGRIMENQGIHLAGVFQGKPQEVVLEDEFGEVRFHLLPFIKPAMVRPFFEEPVESYYDGIKLVVHKSNIDKSIRNVLLTHQFFMNPGSNPERSDSEVGAIGGLDSIDVNVVSHYDYIAMGHLHGAQRIGYDYIRYAGSPLKYSFSEYNQKKSIVMVELGEKGKVDITLLPLTSRRDLRKIKGPLEELLQKEVVESGHREDYLHVTLTDEGEVIDAMAKMRGAYPNIMTLTFDNTRTRATSNFKMEIETKAHTSLELFTAFFEEQNGTSLVETYLEEIIMLVEKDGGDV